MMIVPDLTTLQMPLLSIRARGKWKNEVIFQVIHGKQFRRSYSVYDGSAKAHLVPFQPKFAAGVRSWQALDLSIRRWYHSRASKLGKQMTGFNYYLSLYLRDKL